MKKISKDRKKEILERLERAVNEKYEVKWKDGIPITKKKSNIIRGKKAKAVGARFELKVRKYWEEKNYIIDKWSSNVDLELGKIIPAKRKFNPFKKVMVIGTGFPDFIGIRHIGGESYRVIGIEVKINGLLSKEEKEKCKFYLQKKIFSNILIAKKGEKRGEIEFIDFQEKWGL